MYVTRIARQFRRHTNYLSMMLGSLGPARMVNLAKTEYSRMLRKRESSGLPIFYILDITNRCPLKCPLCLTGSNNSKRRRGTMDLKFYLDILDKIDSSALHVFLYNWGEPLLVDNIVDYIRPAKAKRISTSISTNLNVRLDENKARELVRSGMDRLVISCDGATQEIYEIGRRNGDIGTVFANIKKIVDAKADLGISNPSLEWQYLKNAYNEHQVEEARKLAHEMGVKNFTVGSVQLPYGFSTGEYNRWLPSDADFDYPNTPVIDRQFGYCQWLWRTMVINWDGSVAPCGFVDDPCQDFGDLKTHTVQEIWNNELFQRARAAFSGGSASGLPCAVCGTYRFYKDKAKGA